MNRRALPVILLSLAIASCDNAEQSSKSYYADPSAAPAESATAPMAVYAMVQASANCVDGAERPKAASPTLTTTASPSRWPAPSSKPVSSAPATIARTTLRSMQSHIGLLSSLGRARCSAAGGQPERGLAPREHCAFESSLVAALQDEDKGDIIIKSRQTNAQNVTNQVAILQPGLASSPTTATA